MSSGAFAAEAVDSLARLLLIRIVGRRRVGSDAPNPLTTGAMARLRDNVMEHLAERILVADMAAVVGLSTNRFAHAYADRTGQSPHQFVIQRRLDRAVELLKGTRMGLAETAASCGFASQQHMTQTMRKRLGTTPAKLRTSHGKLDHSSV